MHVRLSELPDTVTLIWALWSREIVIGPPLAVNGPTVVGVPGSSRLRPLGGTGFGIGALIGIAPLLI